MRHSSSTLEALARLSSRTRDAVQGGRACGCFHCLRTFEARDVKEWAPEVEGESAAICPHCGVDSVLPARDGHAVDRTMLEAMQAYWFARAEPPAGDNSAFDKARQRLDPLIRRLTWDLWESRKKEP